MYLCHFCITWINGKTRWALLNHKGGDASASHPQMTLPILSAWESHRQYIIKQNLPFHKIIHLHKAHYSLTHSLTRKKSQGMGASIWHETDNKLSKQENCSRRKWIYNPQKDKSKKDSVLPWDSTEKANNNTL